MDRVALFDKLAERFRALPQDPSFQISYDETDPRAAAESAGRDAVMVMTIQTATEIDRDAAKACHLTSRAAHFARIVLDETIDDDIAPCREAESFGQQAMQAIRYPTAAAENSYLWARAAARAATMVLEGWREIGPILSGAPLNPLPRRFRTLAAAAAKMAGLVEDEASDENAFRAWCKELRCRNYYGKFDILEHPAEASAELCGELSDEALNRSLTPSEEMLARRLARELVVLPLLEEREWTPTEWALKAGVGPAVALDYLSGKTKKLQKTKRQLLAKEIGIPERLLPD
jgi:hypothetical protein